MGAGAVRRVIGLMSGTSLDGVDGVLAESSTASAANAPPLRVLAHAHRPFPSALRDELYALNMPGGTDELSRAAIAANGLVGVYADVVRALLSEVAGSPARPVVAIGAHGQTVRHRPGAVDGIGYTLQLNAPALLAERTGIDVVADFRSRDVAAGGQGAPLVPAFHRAMFARTGEPIAVLNLGGISNLSLIDGDAVLGFDCGPGGVLMDHWIAAHRGLPYDDGGAWAAQGRVDTALLALLQAEPYLALPPPKSTGRDLFHPDWLAARLSARGALPPVDVQATLCEFTAACIAGELVRHAPQTARLIACGGGAYNEHLLSRLRALRPGLPVLRSDEVGLPALQVEAAAFAWLALRCLDRLPGNVPTVTGAAGPRILGAIYPGR